ncbi:MAG: pirin family protein [Alphaproteobacteria bacterium]|nr:pirin family protein [Alphaproteobacteria bacterium]MDE2336078.1 pirin family protein [Alphaproteobacteria bacterium]
MITVKNKKDRGLTEISWLKSYHSFSFGHYYDPKNMGFGPLRVINEDWVEPGTGFDTHGHKNMEIITYILDGALSHKDSTGGTDTIRPGEVQVMSAGSGIMHSEFNGSDTEPVHLLQIWIMPEAVNTAPGYRQKLFVSDEMKNRFRLLVSHDGADGSLPIKQDAKLFAARFDAGAAERVVLESKRKYWLQIARGSVVVSHDGADEKLAAGDALAAGEEQGALDIKAVDDAEVLLFDLPD